MFSELSSVSREQQVALSELFNRVSFLQSFLLMEAHSLSSCCYNGAALCTSYLLTSTQRSSRARYPPHLQTGKAAGKSINDVCVLQVGVVGFGVFKFLPGEEDIPVCDEL